MSETSKPENHDLSNIDPAATNLMEGLNNEMNAALGEEPNLHPDVLDAMQWANERMVASEKVTNAAEEIAHRHFVDSMVTELNAVNEIEQAANVVEAQPNDAVEKAEDIVKLASEKINSDRRKPNITPQTEKIAAHAKIMDAGRATPEQVAKLTESVKGSLPSDAVTQPPSAEAVAERRAIATELERVARQPVGPEFFK